MPTSRDQTLDEGEQTLHAHERAVVERERAVVERERAVVERERAVVVLLDEREQTLNARERAVVERERAMLERERVLVERERAAVLLDERALVEHTSPQVASCDVVANEQVASSSPKQTPKLGGSVTTSAGDYLRVGRLPPQLETPPPAW